MIKHNFKKEESYHITEIRQFVAKENMIIKRKMRKKTAGQNK